MPAVAGVADGQADVGLVEIVVPAEQYVTRWRDSNERRAADVSLRDAHVDESVSYRIGDKVDQLAVGRDPAGGKEFIEIVPSLHLHGVHRTFVVVVVSVAQMRKACDS